MARKEYGKEYPRFPKRIRKITHYRNIVDHCLRAGLDREIDVKRISALTRAAKVGGELFVAEQYLKQINLHQITEDTDDIIENEEPLQIEVLEDEDELTLEDIL